MLVLVNNTVQSSNSTLKLENNLYSYKNCEMLKYAQKKNSHF